MATASSVATSRAALKTLLSAALADVQVTYGPPDASEQQEVVSVRGVVFNEERPAVVNGHYRHEEFRITVDIKVWQPAATDPTVTDARLFELAEAVRDTVLANDNLGGSVDTAFPTGSEMPIGDDFVHPAAGGGWVGLARMFVECNTWIS